MTFGPGAGGVPIIKVQLSDGLGGYLPETWPAATDPLGGGDRPWQSRWDYYRQNRRRVHDRRTRPRRGRARRGLSADRQEADLARI